MKFDIILKEKIDKEFELIFSSFSQEKRLVRKYRKLIGPHEILRKFKMVKIYQSRHMNIIKKYTNNSDALRYINLKICEKAKEIIDYY